MTRFRAVLRRSVYTCIVDRQSRAFTTEIFALSLQDEAVRPVGPSSTTPCGKCTIGLARACVAAGQFKVELPDATLAAVNLLLAAIEGVKLRATFEPRIAAPDEQSSIVEGLLTIFKPVKRTKNENR